MSAELFLARKYIHSHKRQCIGVTLACSLFVAAFITTLIYRESFLATATDDHLQRFGEHLGVVYNADPTKLNQHQSEIELSGSGTVRATGLIETDGTREIHIGTMDFNAMHLFRIELQEGRFPENTGEAAVEASTLNVLFPNAECGDTLNMSISENGVVSTRTFVLVGIIDDYVSKWQSSDSSKQSITYPPPSVLTVYDGSPLAYTHILCADGALEDMLGGQYSVNAHNNLDPSLVSQKKAANTFVTVILLFFVIVLAFGIISNISYIMKNQKQYLTLLRCIGMKTRRGILLFLIQAALLFFASSIVGVFIGFALSTMIAALSSALGRHLVYTASFSSFWPALLISAITIFSSFIFAVKRFFGKMPLDTGKERVLPPAHSTGDVQNLNKLWSRSTAKQNRWSNAVAIMLIAACLFITVFGGFVAMFAPWEKFGNIDSVDLDYTLYVSGGTQNPENYYITIPRKMGVSQKDLDLLRSTEGLQVCSATINHLTSHFVLYSEDSNIPYFEQLIAEDYVLKKKNVPQLSDVIIKLGGTEKDMLVEPRLTGMDYDTAVNSVNIIDGAIDKASFTTGNTIIAPDTFSVGDSFLLVTPLLVDESAPANSAARFDFVAKPVTVSAVYDSAEASSLIYSAEAIIATDDSACYEQIDIINLAPNDVAASKRIENLLSQITARSSYTNLNNFITKRQEHAIDVHNGQVLMAMSVAIFVVMVIIAIAYSVNVKIRAGMRSYMLMRAIGAKKKTVASLIRADIIRLIVKGSTIGIALGISVPILLVIITYQNSPLGKFFLWPCLAAALVFGALLILGYIATQKPIQNLLREDLALALDTVEI